MYVSMIDDICIESGNLNHGNCSGLPISNVISENCLFVLVLRPCRFCPLGKTKHAHESYISIETTEGGCSLSIT